MEHAHEFEWAYAWSHIYIYIYMRVRVCACAWASPRGWQINIAKARMCAINFSAQCVRFVKRHNKQNEEEVKVGAGQGVRTGRAAEVWAGDNDALLTAPLSRQHFLDHFRRCSRQLPDTKLAIVCMSLLLCVCVSASCGMFVRCNRVAIRFRFDL